MVRCVAPTTRPRIRVHDDGIPAHVGYARSKFALTVEAGCVHHLKMRRWSLISLLVGCGGAGSAATGTGFDATTDASTDAGTTQTGDETGDETDDDEGEPAGDLPPEPPPDLPPACQVPQTPDADWIGPLQQDVVARLSGVAEVAPGVSLPDRASVQNRGLAREFLAQTWETMGFEVQTHEYAVAGANLYVSVESTTASEDWMVFGAHFDSVPGSPGANDNATGVAMVLAASRFASELDCRDVNWLFVLFDEEEIGLVGSAAFADSLVASEIDVLAVHTVDQMGWDQDDDRALELERPDVGLFEVYASTVADAGLGTPLHETQTGATDHVSFRARGFAAVGLTEEFVNGDTTPHYHLSSDTYATVDFDYLHASTVLFLHMLTDVTWVDEG